MTERELLLANCLADPADDTARLVYADWLREAGDPLGRSLWAGVTLAGFRGTEPIGDGMFFDAQREVQETAEHVLTLQLDALLGWKWGEILWDQGDETCDQVIAQRFAPAAPGRVRNCRLNRASRYATVTYERGMLCGLRLPLARLREALSDVLAACPLQWAEVLDVPGLTLTVVGPPGGWRMVGELKLPRRTSSTGAASHEYREAPLTIRDSVPASPSPPYKRPEFVYFAPAFAQLLVQSLRDQAGHRWPGATADAGLYDARTDSGTNSEGI